MLELWARRTASPIQITPVVKPLLPTIRGGGERRMRRVMNGDELDYTKTVELWPKVNDRPASERPTEWTRSGCLIKTNACVDVI